MLRTIIVEDEPKNIRILQTILEAHCHEVTVTGVAENIIQAEALIRDTNPHLVLLDIEMPHGNAFQLLDSFEHISFDIIFITAFDNYAIKAFRYSAVDYLLKPVDIDDLKAAIGKIAARTAKNDIDKRILNLLSNIKNPDAHLHKIAIPSVEGLSFLDSNDIVRCEACRGYTMIHTAGGEKIVSSKNISEYEELLPASLFFRVHKSHLVNLNRIKKYHKGRGGYIVMADGATIEVAARRKDEFLALFG